MSTLISVLQSNEEEINEKLNEEGLDMKILEQALERDSASASVSGGEATTTGNSDENGNTNTKKKKSKKSSKKKKKSNNSSSFLVPTHCQEFFSIKENEVQGRYALAKCSIPAGSTVLREEAFEMIVAPSLCSTCTSPVYNSNSQSANQLHASLSFCSKTCQSRFLERHELNYPTFLETVEEVAKSHDCDSKLLRMTCDILAHLNRSPMTANNALFVDCSTVASPSSHQATSAGCVAQESHLAQQSPDWKSTVRSALQNLHQLQMLPSPHLPDESKPSDDDGDILIKESSTLIDYALGIASRINVNSYGIVVSNSSTQFYREDVGFGVFPLAAMMFNHSCEPNLVNVWINNRMEYRTIRDISEGEELSVSYIDIRQSTALRRQTLRNTRYFNCCCARCNAFDACCTRPPNEDLSSNIPKLSDCSDDSMFLLSSSRYTPQQEAESMLSGCYCTNCGPSGVVVSGAEKGDALSFCLKCAMFTPPTIDGNRQCEVDRTTDLAFSSWQDLQQLHGSSYSMPSGTAALSAVEKWLLEFDPLFGHTDSSSVNHSKIFISNDCAIPASGSQYNKPVTVFSPSQVQRYRNVNKLALRLHPRNYLLVEVNRFYAHLLQQADEDARAVGRLKTGLTILTAVVPLHFPEKVDFETILVLSMQQLLKKKRYPKKTIQVIQKDIDEIQKQINIAKLIIYGGEN